MDKNLSELPKKGELVYDGKWASMPARYQGPKQEVRRRERKHDHEFDLPSYPLPERFFCLKAPEMTEIRFETYHEDPEALRASSEYKGGTGAFGW